MFDDYDYKDTGSRIKVKFSQKRDEPMYPWEIAGFLKRFNTVYYKFELLNSICSAVNQGISPEDIFIFDHSLPLYERYSEMDLLSEPLAARLFYPIGMPIPLLPSVNVYEYNCLYRIFNTINSFLKRNHVGPLSLTHISSLYEHLQGFGLEATEARAIQLAYNQAEKSYEAAAKRGEKKKQFSAEDFNKPLDKYKKQKEQLFSDIIKLQQLDDTQRIDILTLDGRENIRLSRLLSSFFTTFEKTTRPLICARVAHNKFRILGRSLVNKQEQVGLELKEIKRNSPLGAIFEGGVAVYQAIQQEKRAKEIHEIEMEIKKKQLEVVEAELHGQKIKNLGLELELSEKLSAIANKTDIVAIRELPASYLKNQVVVAYSVQQSNASHMLHNQGLYLERDSVSIIDLNA
ncbi:hypothetical protein [Pseudomonas chlororaphis]|uniref:hypothetical protein n=1 Tax=Pseudomonas chlororaphis TaxID=587753 RepID=UPI000401CC6C|nr:hypothetical protein [Pseudomonas chlororaphis]